MDGSDLLLEQIEHDIIRRSAFSVEMTGTPRATAIDCDMSPRGRLTVHVERRQSRWAMSDRCSTVRAVGWLWMDHPLDVLEICERSGVEEASGELRVYVDADDIYMSFCSLLCAMLELRNLSRHLRAQKERRT